MPAETVIWSVRKYISEKLDLYSTLGFVYFEFVPTNLQEIVNKYFV
jgi:hypothetical protein